MLFKIPTADTDGSVLHFSSSLTKQTSADLMLYVGKPVCAVNRVENKRIAEVLGQIQIKPIAVTEYLTENGFDVERAKGSTEYHNELLRQFKKLNLKYFKKLGTEKGQHDAYEMEASNTLRVITQVVWCLPDQSRAYVDEAD